MATENKSLTRKTVETGLKIAGWAVVLGVAFLGLKYVVGAATT